MSKEKFSPQLLKSILESEGINTGETNDVPTLLKPPHKSSNSSLGTLERKKALTQLASLISQFRSSSDNTDELASFSLKELPNILQLLAELAVEAKNSDKNREEKKRCFMWLRPCCAVCYICLMQIITGFLD